MPPMKLGMDFAVAQMMLPRVAQTAPEMKT